MSITTENLLNNGDITHIAGEQNKPYRLWRDETHVIFAAKHLGETDAKSDYDRPGFTHYLSLAAGLVSYKGEWSHGFPLGYRLPTVETLNAHKASTFEPIGSHGAQFELAFSTKGKGDEFAAKEIVDAVAEDTLLVGATPHFFHHDIHDHSIQAASVSTYSMNRLKGLCRVAAKLWTSDPRLARPVSSAIAAGFDSITEATQYYDSIDAVSDSDFVMTSIMQASGRHTPTQRFIGGVLTTAGLNVRLDMTVEDHPANAEYYHALRTAV